MPRRGSVGSRPKPPVVTSGLRSAARGPEGHDQALGQPQAVLAARVVAGATSAQRCSSTLVADPACTRTKTAGCATTGTTHW